jgi:hypothetical protein
MVVLQVDGSPECRIQLGGERVKGSLRQRPVDAFVTRRLARIDRGKLHGVFDGIPPKCQNARLDFTRTTSSLQDATCKKRSTFTWLTLTSARQDMPADCNGFSAVESAYYSLTIEISVQSSFDTSDSALTEFTLEGNSRVNFIKEELEMSKLLCTLNAMTSNF